LRSVTGGHSDAVRRRPRSAAETGLEPSGVRGREGRRLPVVVPEPQVAAQRRDSQRRPAPTPHGQLQPPATENGQVSRVVYMIII